jgi:hypothetical protein
MVEHDIAYAKDVDIGKRIDDGGEFVHNGPLQHEMGRDGCVLYKKLPENVSSCRPSEMLSQTDSASHKNYL